METTANQLSVVLQNNIIHATLAGLITEPLILERHARVLRLIKDSGCKAVLYNTLSVGPPSLNALELQRKLSVEFQKIEVKLAVVVSQRRLVHLAKLAFGDLNYRVFCESVNDALQWLQWTPLNTEQPKRVLIADVPAAIPILTSALGQDYHLLPRTSWAGACAAVQDGIDVVLCGIGFEESMMFDLLVYLRNQEETRATPFFCIKCIGQKLPSTLNDGIEIALHAKGPGGYVDFEAWQLSVGEHRASISLREKISGSLSAQA